jgi:hypothetical protein
VETIVERAVRVGCAQAQVTACMRVPGRGRERAEEVAEFATTVRGLLSLGEWLKAHRVTQVAMEATGVTSSSDDSERRSDQAHRLLRAARSR